MHLGRIYLHLLADQSLVHIGGRRALVARLGDHRVALRQLLNVLRVGRLRYDVTSDHGAAGLAGPMTADPGLI